MRIDEDYFKVDNPMQHNTVEDILDEEETILYRGKPNRKVLILEAIFKGLPFVAIWAAFDIFFISSMIVAGAFKDDPKLLWIIIPFFAIHLFPLWAYIANVVKTVAAGKNIEYVFTDRRIIVRSGMIGIDFKCIFYSDVEGINCKVGLFDRIYKVGDLYIKAKDQSAVLMNLENPYHLLSRLQKITHDIKTDIQYPNDLRPNENHGYNTKYKG